MPSEYAFTRLPAAALRPTRSRASAIRFERVRPSARRSAESRRRRFAAPERYGAKPGPSTSAPTRGSTVAQPSGIGSPSTSTEPLVAPIRPRSIRMVVVLPDPFGPRNP